MLFKNFPTVSKEGNIGECPAQKKILVSISDPRLGKTPREMLENHNQLVQMLLVNALRRYKAVSHIPEASTVHVNKHHYLCLASIGEQ